MRERVKLPVFPSLTLTLRWTVAIVKRHWGLMLAYALVGLALLAAFFWFSFAVVIPSMPVQPFQVAMLIVLGVVGMFAYNSSLAFLALIVHNEILRGPAGFDAATMGRGGSRAFGYVLDCLLMGLATMTFFALGMGGAILLLGMGSHVLGKGPHALVGLLIFLGFIAIWLAAMGMMLRLLLRLPSRALGQPLPWRDVWSMGRGSTLRLLAGMVILSALLGLAAGMVSTPVQFELLRSFPWPGTFPGPSHGPMNVGFQIISPPSGHPVSLPLIPLLVNALIIGISLPLEVILFCAFLSVAYAQLRDNLPIRNEDMPPWEYDDDYR